MKVACSISTSFLNIAVYGMAIPVFVLTGHIPPTTRLFCLPVLVLCANFQPTLIFIVTHEIREAGLGELFLKNILCYATMLSTALDTEEAES